MSQTQLNHSTLLPRDNWDDSVYQALCHLIETVGKGSVSYDVQCSPYAVFDFDNTTIMSDIEFTIFEYLISRVAFDTERDGMYQLLMDVIENESLELSMPDGSYLKASDLAADIADDYLFLYDNFLSPDAGMSFEQVQETPQYLDFRAKLRAMHLGVTETLDAVGSAAWLLRFTKGMTPLTVTTLARDVAEMALSEQSIVEKVWESPQMGRTGKVKAVFDSGMSLPIEMVHLYNALMVNGIEVYICSASLEDTVKGFVSRYLLDVKPQNIFGMHIGKDSRGSYTGYYEADYPPTVEAGKVECIKRFIAPRHGGKDPVLVAGDSNGDYHMLSAFDNLSLGLIIDRAANEPLASLYGVKGYLLQGRDPSSGKYIRSSESLPVK